MMFRLALPAEAEQLDREPLSWNNLVALFACARSTGMQISASLWAQN